MREELGRQFEAKAKHLRTENDHMRKTLYKHNLYLWSDNDIV
jgi:hypothetical protein